MLPYPSKFLRRRVPGFDAALEEYDARVVLLWGPTHDRPNPNERTDLRRFPDRLVRPKTFPDPRLIGTHVSVL